MKFEEPRLWERIVFKLQDMDWDKIAERFCITTWLVVGCYYIYKVWA